MCQSKVHPCLLVPLGKEGLFLLYHSFRTSCLQAIAQSLGGEGLVGDIPECLGHINSSVSLPRADKALCMANICRGELKETTTKRLGEVRTMFRTKPRDCVNTMASGSCNMIS